MSMSDDRPAGVSDDIAFSTFGIEWFAATGDRPVRPDVAFLRNWSHTKSHAVQLGVAFAVGAYAAVAWGYESVVVAAGVAIVVWLASAAQARSTSSTCQHTAGVHDIEDKPHYFTTAVGAVLVILIAVFGWPVV